MLNKMFFPYLTYNNLKLYYNVKIKKLIEIIIIYSNAAFILLTSDDSYITLK
jgi:hypothetical protein